MIENPALTPTGFDALAALRTTLDRQRIAMCVFDRDDGIVSWNETYLAIFPEEADILAPGLPYRETLRRFYEVNLPSAELAAIEQHLEAGLERHRTQRDPFIYQRKDGRWIKSDSQRLENGYLLKTWVDFTEDGLAAQDWPDLKDAFANIDIAFALFGADGRFVSANKMYTQMFPYCVDLNLSGTPYQEHLLRHAEHTIDPSEHWRESIPLARALNASGALRGGIILRRRGGGWLQLEERPTKSGGMISFWSDVSERVQAQSQVETLQARLSDAIESLTEGVALYDQDERLLLCNQRYREINHAIADVIRPGMAWIDLLRAGVERGMFPEAAADPQTWIAERLTQRKNSGESFDIPLADGSWIRCTDRRTRDGGTISVRSDITDLKRREVELSRQANMLSAVSYAATRLIGNADFASTITELLAKIGTALTACRVLVFQCYDRPRIGAVWACRYEWRLPEVSSILDDSEYREVAMVDADPIVRDWNERLLRGEIIEYRFSQLPDSLRLTMKHDRHRVLTFVSVPIMIGGVCWGSLDVDDCRSERHWSAVDIEVLKTAAALLAGIVERSRVDAELRASEARFRAQAEMLEAISYAATRLIGKQSWQLAVNDLLARLGHAARVSRVAVLQVQTLPSGELAQSVRFDWAAPGVVTLSDDPHYQDENLADADPMLSDWVERRKRGAIVQAKASELTAYLRAEFERQNTLSFLSVPIMVEGAWWGHICFDDCQAERDWNGAEVDVLRTAASLLAGIIERSRVDDELRNSEQRFRTIAESIPVAINAVNGHGQVLYASPLAAALFRTPQDAASLARLTAAQFFADHQQRHYFLHQFRNTGTVENTELSLKRLDGTALPAVVTSSASSMTANRLVSAF
ncbi:MAG: PAS-domain containing protein [Gammaproteobacteria bacterium]